MNMKEAIKMLNGQIPEDMDAVIVLLVGLQSELMTTEELSQLDTLRGNKLNLVHESSWHPELITREDAKLIQRGLDVYRSVLWELNKDEMMNSIKSVISKLGKNTESEEV